MSALKLFDTYAKQHVASRGEVSLEMIQWKNKVWAMRICVDRSEWLRCKRSQKQVERSSDYRSVLARTCTHHCTFTCSVVLLLLKSSSGSHTFLFQTHIYLNFGQKRHFFMISTCVWPTDRRTDGRTDGPTDGRTHPLIEMRERI